jgi:hypothetical protein
MWIHIVGTYHCSQKQPFYMVQLKCCTSHQLSQLERHDSSETALLHGNTIVVFRPTIDTCFAHLPIIGQPATWLREIKGMAFQAHSHTFQKSKQTCQKSNSKSCQRSNNLVISLCIAAATCLQCTAVQPCIISERISNRNPGWTRGSNTAMLAALQHVPCYSPAVCVLHAQLEQCQKQS